MVPQTPMSTIVTYTKTSVSTNKLRKGTQEHNTEMQRHIYTDRSDFTILHSVFGMVHFCCSIWLLIRH